MCFLSQERGQFNRTRSVWVKIFSPRVHSRGEVDQLGLSWLPKLERKVEDLKMGPEKVVGAEFVACVSTRNCMLLASASCNLKVIPHADGSLKQARGATQ